MTKKALEPKHFKRALEQRGKKRGLRGAALTSYVNSNLSKMGWPPNGGNPRATALGIK